MSIYCTSKNGKQYALKEPYIGKGGEGAVYEIEGHADMVAKLYFDGKGKNDHEKEEKLFTMIQSSLPKEAFDQVAWPFDILYNNGNFVGYVMRKVTSGEGLNTIYSDKYKLKLSLDKRIIIAKNLCAAVDAVHGVNQVIGDFNPNNILVVPSNCNIILVDTDSYHITNSRNGKVYRCIVGLPQYVAKELQIKMSRGSYTYANIPFPSFTEKTDLFALAVHIFAILMNGCHPFACAEGTGTLGSGNINMATSQQSSVVMPQPNENICEGFFPFAQKRSGITIPCYAPRYDMLTKNVRNMFAKAFIDGDVNPGKRPSAEEWYHALEEMEKHLVRCGQNHVYCDHSNECPWCELDVRLGMQSTLLKNQSYVNKINPAVNSVIPPEPDWDQVSTWGKRSTFWIVTLLMAVVVLAGTYFFTSPSWLHFNSGNYIESNGSTGIGVFGQLFVFIGGVAGVFMYNTKAQTGLEGYTAENYFLSVGSCILGCVLGLVASAVLGIVFPIVVIGGILLCLISTIG